MNAGVDISLVTPVKNGFRTLPCACASILSQGDGVASELLVIDGGSTDGTVEWLKSAAPDGRMGGGGDRELRTEDRSPMPDIRFRWLSEPDQGMYDALNKGFDLSSGEILGWLNADEQHLPGTLAFVGEWFGEHPGLDLLFGDHLIVGEDGALLARRRTMPMRWPYVLASHLYGLTCAMFFRRRVWDDRIRFDSSFQSAGDADWVVRVLRAGYRAGTTDRPLAAFMFRSGSLSRQAVSREEERRLLSTAPAWVRRGRGVVNWLRRAEMALRGACRRTPFIEYELFVGSSPQRRRFQARNVDWRWPAA